MHLKPYLLVGAIVGAGCSDDPCDPVGQTGCDDGNVCERVAGGEPACFAPVAVEGKVFDISNQDGIENARIVAVDVNGAAVSNVVKSGTDGSYRLPIPTERNSDGTPVKLEGSVTLRSDAYQYESFPGTVRQPLPIDMASATKTDDRWVVKSTLTDIAMSKLADGGSIGVIEGKVELPDDETTGIVVVAELDGTGYATVAARDGSYAILNVAPGAYNVTAYAADHNYLGGSANVNNNTAKLDVKLSDDTASPVSGQVSIVNGDGAMVTSVVLFIESTYDPITGRGVTVPGLRAPRTGAPDISGAFTMEGVPAGNYVIVAAFENDGLVRDPDQCIAGTDDVHITVAANTPFTVPETFKITGALNVIDPGAAGAQSVTGAPTFSWGDDSSEDQYIVDLFDSYGQMVWTKTIAGFNGGTPTLAYDGPALMQGMFYQFRVTSARTTNTGACNISRTEDLKGVFYLP